MKPYRVTHISTVHSVYDTRIFHKECKSLVKHGFHVNLIVTHDKAEVIDGVNIIPLPKSKSRFSRILMKPFLAFIMALKTRSDVIHFHDPELIFIGVLMKLFGKKVIYDVHEDVPNQILDKHWIPKKLRGKVSKAIEFFEWLSSNFFYNGIIVATETIGRRFPEEKTIVVKNFFILESINDKASDTPYKKRPNAAIYLGGITELRGIKEMVKAIELIPNHLQASLHLAGEFTPTTLLTEAQGLPGWDRVTYVGLQTHEQSLTMLNSARVGLAVLHPTNCYKESLPIKLFEYMAAGIPVIASNFPLWKPIVEHHKSGILVDPLNTQEIAQAIEWILTHPSEAQAMGERGKQAVKEKYNWDMEEKKLIQLYKELQFPRTASS